MRWCSFAPFSSRRDKSAETRAIVADTLLILRSTWSREIWCAIDMGVLWWYSSAVLVRLLLGGCCFCLVSSAARVERAAVEKSVTGVCDIPGCNCSDTAKIWKIINCTFNSTQASVMCIGNKTKILLIITNQR